MANKDNLEKLVEISNKVEEKHPTFVAYTKFIVGEKRVGLQMYDGDTLTEEYTLLINGYLITGYENNIKEPFITLRMQEKFLDDFVKQEDFIVAHPILARLRYFPINLLKGNIKFGRAK